MPDLFTTNLRNTNLRRAVRKNILLFIVFYSCFSMRLFAQQESGDRTANDSIVSVNELKRRVANEQQKKQAEITQNNWDLQYDSDHPDNAPWKQTDISADELKNTIKPSGSLEGSIGAPDIDKLKTNIPDVK
ncbi:MAG TPA: hypothetical protein VK625_23635, partial [Flavitalea sp.]|nr:hypothetical protein [Flavitalea sp.]